MIELVERYVHQVGRYLPRSERAEIEAELRSQIQDQLDDRFAGSPTPEEVASVLAEFGHPYRMATSYTGEQYLVGPALYPFMMMVLRYGWLIIPPLVIFLDIFGALVTPSQTALLTQILEILGSVIQATLFFSAVVVLIFALIQRASLEVKDKEPTFNPADLPKVDDPSVVDRAESSFGIAITAIITLVLLYWLQVGGLTLRFNLSDPGEVIPVSVPWLIALIAISWSQAILHIVVLRRNRWSVGLLVTETVMETAGLIPLYFAVLLPFVGRLDTRHDLPEIIAIVLAVLTLLTKGARLARLWNYADNQPARVKAKRTE